MYVYKISELLNSLQQAKKDGFEYVSLSVLEPEEDLSESVSLDYVHSCNDCEADFIDSVLLPDGYYFPF